MDPVSKQEKIEMLSQPLLTEDGFINPACINELENTIAKAPKTFERLADNKEWSTPRATFIKQIIAAFASNAITLSPYTVPENLETILKYLDRCLTSELLKNGDNSGFDQMYNLSLCDINRLLYAVLYDLEQIKAWNEPKNKTADKIVFTSRDSAKPDPDDDFIDIGALFHNTCLTIRSERREFDRFDAEFEKNWQKKHPD